jgi:hypothetical protein
LTSEEMKTARLFRNSPLTSSSQSLDAEPSDREPLPRAPVRLQQSIPIVMLLQPQQPPVATCKCSPVGVGMFTGTQDKASILVRVDRKMFSVLSLCFELATNYSVAVACLILPRHWTTTTAATHQEEDNCVVFASITFPSCADAPVCR